jgi:hypothetical protein
MVAESLVCPSCRESIPSGRLSCPECGAVVAAVAHRVGLDSAGRSSDVAGSGPIPNLLLPADGDPAAEAWTDAGSDDAKPVVGPAPAVRSPWPAAPAAPPASFAPASFAPASFAPPREADPPSAAPAPLPAAPAPPAPIPAQASPSVLADPPPAAILPRAWDPAAAAAGEGVLPAAPAEGASRLPRVALPRVSRDRVEETADVVLLGGAMGLAIAFLVPWSNVVLGARGRGGYTDTWGLAGSGHLIVFLLALGVLALAVLDNPIGRWLRTGVLGLALGAFTIGLLWPYVVGPLDAGPGVLLAFASSILLLVGGSVSLLVLRHAALPPDV